MMTTMAQIGLTKFDPLLNRVCPGCGAEHHRIDLLCLACRTIKAKRQRARSLKTHRVIKRMADSRLTRNSIWDAKTVL